MVVNKPDLPPEYWQQAEATCKCATSGGGGESCRLCRKAAALAQYEGPSAFMIPGNHDWVDG